MKEFNINDLIDNKKEISNLSFKNCLITSIASNRVSQTIYSKAYLLYHDPSFREEIPTPKYITVTATISDGHFAHTITFSALAAEVISEKEEV